MKLRLGSHSTSFYDLGSRSTNFYDLHRVNQGVIKKKKKKNTKTSIRKNEKDRRCLLWLKKKKQFKKKKNGAQLPLTHKTSPSFIEVILARNPSDSQKGS